MPFHKEVSTLEALAAKTVYRQISSAIKGHDFGLKFREALRTAETILADPRFPLEMVESLMNKLVSRPEGLTAVEKLLARSVRLSQRIRNLNFRSKIPESPKNVLKPLSNLTRFTMRQYCDDPMLTALVQFCPQLRLVDISQSGKKPGVTEDGVVQLYGLRKLEFLSLVHCDKVPDNAVKYLLREHSGVLRKLHYDDTLQMILELSEELERTKKIKKNVDSTEDAYVINKIMGFHDPPNKRLRQLINRVKAANFKKNFPAISEVSMTVSPSCVTPDDIERIFEGFDIKVAKLRVCLHQIPNSRFDRMVFNVFGKLETLVLRFDSLSESTLINIGDACPGLQNLTLEGNHLGGNMDANNNQVSRSVASDANNNIRHVPFGQLSNLEIGVLTRPCNCTDTVHDRVSYQISSILMKNAKDLKDLRFESDVSYTGGMIKDYIAGRMNNLRNLHIQGNDDCDQDLAKQLVESLPELDKLTLTNWNLDRNEKDSILKWLSARNAKVETKILLEHQPIYDPFKMLW